MSTDEFSWVDTNNDGVGDVGMGDENRDGIADSYLVDTNFDGISDTFAADADQDGRIEAAMVDANQDGVFETVVQDADQNGVVELSGTDTDGDGTFDVIQRDADQDGVEDSQQYTTVTVGGGTGGYNGPFSELVNLPQFQTDPEFRRQVQEMIESQNRTIDTILRPSDDPYDPYD